jgi:hypothetical protein
MNRLCFQSLFLPQVGGRHNLQLDQLNDFAGTLPAGFAAYGLLSSPRLQTNRSKSRLSQQYSLTWGPLRAARPTGKIDSFLGLLAGKTRKVATLDEINEAAAAGWAGQK